MPLKTPLDLSQEERDLLVSILNDRLGTLREQVYHTDTTSFKGELRSQKELLQGLIAKL